MTRPKRRSKRKTSEKTAEKTQEKTEPRRPRAGSQPHTLTIDIGGTGIKMLVVDNAGAALNERLRELTPKPATPEAVLAVIAKMVEVVPAFDRVSVGFPGVVMHGVVRTAPNLGDELWQNVDVDEKLTKLLNKPVRVINDADLQGYGVVHGQGVELVLTLGTGLGSALYLDGRLVPNLELGHHPFRRNKTYEQRLSDRQLKRIGARRWSKRVHQAILQLAPIFNYDHLHLGGGNAPELKGKLPDEVSVFDNVQGMKGGLLLWRHEVPPRVHPKRKAASKAATAPESGAPPDNSDGAAS
jgi:polyphosphate glucokinase